MDTNLKNTLQSVVDKCKLIFQPVTTNGYAELNEYGYVKTSQLPGFVDDIIEGYYNSIDGKFYTTESYTSEIIPEGGKIYVSLDSNKTYRWSSSSYVVISETIALGETSSTAFAGDKGKANSEAITTLQTSILNKLDKTMNLSDVQNRQIAADNLLNASSSNAEKFVYVNSNGNVDFAEKLALTAGVYSNEVSGHGHRYDYYDSQTPYGPIMKFRHLNGMNKFQIDFTIMSVDTTASTNPSFVAKYTFFRTTAFSPEGKLVCNYYSTTDKEGFSYEDVIAVPSVEGGVPYTTFYKRTKSSFDWYCYIVHSISKYSLDGLSGYIVPTYYIGAPRDTPEKLAEVALDSSMYKSVSDFSEIWRPIQTEYSQHIFGKYNNVEDEYEQNYIEIAGKGTDTTHRSNARTLDWQGNEVLAGNLTIGGTITANGQQILPQKQADWNQTTSEESDYIKNKPTKLSDFINDGEGDSPLNPFTTTEDVTNRISAHNSDITTHEDIRLSVASQGGRISAVEELIPVQATSSNNLADKEFVNSSISTNTANFKGTYNTLAELEATTADNNDYGFIITTDASGNMVYNRYKYDGTSWSYEYSLNNSAFTAAQWDAINSNATASIISDLLSHASNISNPHAVTKSQVGLGDVDNTSDLNKPLSTAAVAEFATKQDTLIAGNNITIVGNTISSTGGGGPTTVYKSITIENPTASENMCIFYAPVAMTITEIRGVITGATSVSFKVVSGTSRNAVTTEHNSSPVVCSSVTTGNVATITTNAVAAGSWVAVKTSAVSGAPSELVITLSLNY